MRSRSVDIANTFFNDREVMRMPRLKSNRPCRFSRTAILYHTAVSTSGLRMADRQASETEPAADVAAGSLVRLRNRTSSKADLWPQGHAQIVVATVIKVDIVARFQSNANR